MRENLEEREASLMLSVEELEMPPTAEGILTTLRRILTKPYVQSITLRTGRPMEVVWYKAISDSLRIGEPEEAADVVLARIALEEFSTTKSPKETLLDAMLFLGQKRLYSSHIFVGSIQFFRDWMGIPTVVALERQDGPDGSEYYNFIGLHLVEVDTLEEDSVVLLGAEARGATTTETSFGLRIVT